jgi:hypothetical protein
VGVSLIGVIAGLREVQAVGTELRQAATRDSGVFQDNIDVWAVLQQRVRCELCVMS